MEKIKKVFIEPGCTTCGSCEFIAPEVFEVTDVARVKKNANIKDNQDTIEQAVAACPVFVIKTKKE